MNDFDTRLRSRLVALADIAGRASGTSQVRRRAVSGLQTRAAFPIGFATVAIVIVAALAVLPRLAEQPGPAQLSSAPPSSPSTPSATPLSSGGISRDRAVALAEPHKSLSTTFKSAEAGAFGDLNPSPNVGPGFGVAPQQEVWAVTYVGDMTICSPLGACELPRPGTLTIFLDYFTGEFLGSAGYSPTP